MNFIYFSRIKTYLFWEMCGNNFENVFHEMLMIWRSNPFWSEGQPKPNCNFIRKCKKFFNYHIFMILSAFILFLSNRKSTMTTISIQLVWLNHLSVLLNLSAEYGLLAFYTPLDTLALCVLVLHPPVSVDKFLLLDDLLRFLTEIESKSFS